MPDATGLELIAQAVRDNVGDDAVVGTSYEHEQATLEVAPGSIREVLVFLTRERSARRQFPLGWAAGALVMIAGVAALGWWLS